MRFRFLTGDVHWQEYGGLFYGHVYQRVYDVIRWGGADTHYAHPQAGPGGITVYHADKIAFDLDRCDESGDSDAALVSCGYRRDQGGIWSGGDKIAPPSGPDHDRELLICLAYYGGDDRIMSSSDTNWRRLYRESRDA